MGEKVLFYCLRTILSTAVALGACIWLGWNGKLFVGILWVIWANSINSIKFKDIESRQGEV